MTQNAERRAFNCEFRTDPEQPNKVTGYSAVFNSLSLDLGGFRERILPGAFQRVLEAPDIDVIACRDHSTKVEDMFGRYRKVGGKVINDTLQLSENENGLLVGFSLPDTTAGRDTQVLMGPNRRDVSQMSFAFNVDPDGEVWTRDEDGNSIREIRAVSGLFDCSIVIFPAYPDASCALRSFERWQQTQAKTNQVNLRWQFNKRILQLHE